MGRLLAAVGVAVIAGSVYLYWSSDERRIARLLDDSENVLDGQNIVVRKQA